MLPSCRLPSSLLGPAVVFLLTGCASTPLTDPFEACEAAALEAFESANSDWRAALDSMVANSPADSQRTFGVRFIDGPSAADDSIMQALGAVVTYRFHYQPAVMLALRIDRVGTLAAWPRTDVVTFAGGPATFEGCP